MEQVPRYWPICAEKPPITGGFLAQRVSHSDIDYVLYVNLIKPLNKQSSGG